MTLTPDQLKARLILPTYPRSAKYDPAWVLENMMGPNVLWLAESLTQVMELQPGMRVLDMGCGKAISSIFLAKEFGVQVWANDLWINATENWQRIIQAGAQEQVFPIHAEAHDLPYAEGFFDVLVSFDAYHYFGTDDLYLGYYAQFVKPGGQIGIVVPGVQHEFTNGLPEHLAPNWPWEFFSFHSPDWWRNHWEKTGKVEDVRASTLPEGWKQWLDWNYLCKETGYPYGEEDIVLLEADRGQFLGFTRVVARKK